MNRKQVLLFGSLATSAVALTAFPLPTVFAQKPIAPATAKPPPTPSLNCDADGDGHRAATAACGGDDCDDHDPYRHPGATEFCNGRLPDGREAAQHDEDCNPCTVYNPAILTDGDADSDEFPSSACMNPWLTSVAPVGCDLRHTSVAAQGQTSGFVIGNDCDDTNASLMPGSQACAPAPDPRVKVCGAPLIPSGVFLGHGGVWAYRDCPRGPNGAGRCVAQPNGTGVCVN